MKLFYVVDKWRADNTVSFLPDYDSYDCLDLEYTKFINLRLFTEYQLFGFNISEKYDENISLQDNKKKGRVLSIYSIDTSELPNIFILVEHKFYYMLQVQNNENSWEKYNEDNSYNINYKNLNWKLNGHICVNLENLNLGLNLPDNSEGDIKNLFKIILHGDHPDRLIRLNYLSKIWDNDIESAKELYEILYDFTCGDYYDFCADSSYYYRAMKFLRDTYDVDPNY